MRTDNARNRSSFIDLPKAVLAGWLTSLFCLTPQLHAADDRPNIVVIMGDDWSWPHAGILGDPVVATPTFDRIAREGVLFENAFVTAPSCTSSRFAVVTGQYHWRLAEGDSLGGSLAVDVPVYPDLLAQAGYRTGFCRKGAGPSKHTHRGNDPFGPRFKNFDEFMARRKADEPFCFWYGAGEPHRPYDWQASHNSALDMQKIVVPACLPDNETVRTDIGDYYLRVQKLDDFAGQILKRLEDSGELENTIVVMTGDNGMPFPRCKATLYDTGTRVPLAIRWGQRVKAGGSIKDYVSLTDLAPTLLDASGLPIPSQMTGRSLLPQLSAERSGWVETERDHVLVGRERHVYQQPSRAIRTQDFLYVRNFSPDSWPTGEGNGQPPHYDFQSTPWPTTPPAFSFDVDPSPTKQWMQEHADRNDGVRRLNELAFGTRSSDELYDLKHDPQQLQNVVVDPKYAGPRNELSDQLTDELRASGDPRFSLTGHATFAVNGWTVHLNDKLWRDEAEKTKQMLGLLTVQLDRVIDVVPPAALKQLRAVPIWINPMYDGVRPTAEYHPGAGWLRDNGRDAAMEKAIEITNVSNFAFEDRRMPCLMLHELAHAYHDRVLGFDEPAVVATFEVARESGGYEKVKRFNGRTTVIDRAYALSNHKEYFAESTEAYFGKNDFYPSNRAELKTHDLQMHNLVRKLWGAE